MDANSHNTNGYHGTDNSSASKRGIPPQILWPMVVVALLLSSVSWTMWMVYSSQSDGGAQVIENYYEKAISWDERSEVLAKSEALGWSVALNYKPADKALELRFTDADGNALEGLTGNVNITIPEVTGAIDTFELAGLEGEAGVYTYAFTPTRSGIWDFEIDVKQGPSRFVKAVRTEL